MFILSTTQRRINIYAPYTDAAGTQYPNLLASEFREVLGVTEIPDPVPPADYSEETYYRTEQDEVPYVVFTKKSDEQIEQVRVSKLQAQIAALEATSLLPRVTREFMLVAFAAQAQAAGVDPMTNFGFKRVKELDDQITALRSAL